MTILVVPTRLGPAVDGWFTGRDVAPPGDSPDAGPLIGEAGNLSHRRPHLPTVLAADRAQVAGIIGYPAAQWHLMRQVHSRRVAIVDRSLPPGTELRDVDGAVTTLEDRPLVVQVADCVPVLLAGDHTIGVAHAGRRGVHAGIVAAVIAAMGDLGEEPADLRVAIGPAIGGCCYEVPSSLQEEVGAAEPAALATTTWGTPALDLPAAVEAQVRRAGVRDVSRLASCTRCDPRKRWFSHRADPGSGRQVGIVVRPSPGRRGAQEQL